MWVGIFTPSLTKTYPGVRCYLKSKIIKKLDENSNSLWFLLTYTGLFMHIHDNIKKKKYANILRQQITKTKFVRVTVYVIMYSEW